MKTVVYGATRNIYKNLVPCVRSLMKNGNVDEIIYLLEDDEVPFALPGRAINVSHQKWFDPKGANASKRWTYMTMMKCCLTKLLPDHERVVFLDCDTIVHHDLTELYEIDMTGKWYGLVPQNGDGRDGWFTKGNYYNCGVLLANLKEVNEDILIKALQTKDYEFPEQDCINELCQDKILPLQGRWNTSEFTVKDTWVYIRHYAANREWYKRAEVQIYGEL